LHGIERTRKLSGPLAQDQGVSRVVVRYSDGRVLDFVPDAGGEVFNEDDLLELEKVFVRASSAAEWAEMSDVAGGY
jgi:hypothetical protein